MFWYKFVLVYIIEKSIFQGPCTSLYTFFAYIGCTFQFSNMADFRVFKPYPHSIITPLWQYCKQGELFFHQQFIWSYFCPGWGGVKQKNKHPVVQYCTVHCSRIVDCTYLYDPPPLLTINMYKYIVFLIVGSAK